MKNKENLNSPNTEVCPLCSSIANFLPLSREIIKDKLHISYKCISCDLVFEKVLQLKTKG
jgi:uncharacterized Zn finger protein